MIRFQEHFAAGLLTAVLALTGCAHATKTASQEAQPETGKEKPKEKAEDPGAKKQAAAPATDKTDKTPNRSEAITTSKTTNEMFKEEGLKKLQHKLAEKTKGLEETGKLDTKTQEALRSYQKDQKLPDTGLPDYETIRRLGVKPEEVYEHAPPAQRVGVP